MAVFLLIIGVAVGIFISVVQNQRKILSEQELINQASYAVEHMSKALRVAKKDTIGDVTQGGCLGVDYAGYNYMLTRPVNGFYTGIKFINSSDNDACQEFFLDGYVLKEIKNGSPSAGVAVTSEKLKINSIRFVINGDGRIENFVDAPGIQPRVAIFLDIQVAGDTQQPAKKIQTTVSQRNINAPGSGSPSPQWLYSKAITISKANVDVNLNNFPLLVKLTDRADFAAARGDGFDIRFFDSDGITPLPYERESWSGGNGSAVTASFWVKVPTISATNDTTIYIYYGVTADVPDGQDVANVWDANYKAVFHLNESGAPYNSVIGSVSSVSGTYPAQIAGKINFGQDFAANDISFGDNPALHIAGNQVTVSAWIKPSSVATQGLVSKINGSAVGQYGLWIRGTGMAEFLVDNISGSGYTFKRTFAIMSVGNWYNLVGVYDGTDIKVYSNGIEQGTPVAATSNIENNTTPFVIGAIQLNSARFNGIIDEVRVSAVERSAEWIKFEYYNINSVNNELTIP